MYLAIYDDKRTGERAIERFDGFNDAGKAIGRNANGREGISAIVTRRNFCKGGSPPRTRRTHGQ